LNRRNAGFKDEGMMTGACRKTVGFSYDPSRRWR
jgi:hypothetical protein